MIRAENLSKRYRGTQVVDDLSFSCEAGTITGFLGPNGSGKSTTLRMICGLTKPSSGSSTICGTPFSKFRNPATTVGAVLDTSGINANRTGYEALAVAAQQVGVTAKRASELLEFVGLSNQVGSRKISSYSLGMRQRIGLAHALIGDPSVLILDEPVNGLDPEGIHWIRTFLRSFANEGGTVLLSSHLMSEIQLIADQLLVIDQGRMLATGGVNELISKNQATYARSLNNDQLEAGLIERGFTVKAAQAGGLIVEGANAQQVGELALELRVALTELRTEDSHGLEQAFLNLVTEGKHA